MLFDLWRWRRLGGGQDVEVLPHQAALQDIQRYKIEVRAEGVIKPREGQK